MVGTFDPTMLLLVRSINRGNRPISQNSQNGLTGKLLTFRKPSLEERRLNEASQPAESNLIKSILKRLAHTPETAQGRTAFARRLPQRVNLPVRGARTSYPLGCGRVCVSREDRLLSGCHLAGVDVSRMVPTLGSDLFSMWNGRSSLNGALEGFVLVKRLKRIKLERWH